MNQKQTISEIYNHCYKLADAAIVNLINEYSFTFGISSFVTSTDIIQARVIYFDNINKKLVFNEKGEVILVVNTLNDKDTVAPDEYERIKLALALNLMFAKVEDVTEKSLMEYTHGIFDYFEV